MFSYFKKVIPITVKRRIKNSMYYIVENVFNRLLVINKTKIFCIGRNKTGTTSFKKAMQDLGFIVGNQRKAEMLFYDYHNGNFKPIIDYCRTAQVFQDFPFSAPETYKHLDKAFPNSKFVLTIRNSPEEWHNSMVNFHSKIFGKGKVPTKEDLQNATYIWKGRPWESKKFAGMPEDDPYNKEIMINQYVIYNNEVIRYFSNHPDKLLVINIAEMGSYQKLLDFLGIKVSPYKEFPWENKTSDKKIKI